MMIEFREPGLLYPKQDLDSGPPSIANAVLARGMVQVLEIPLHETKEVEPSGLQVRWIMLPIQTYML